MTKRPSDHDVAQNTKPRARDLGIPFAGTTGNRNAITDVDGVTVGHTTLISGEGQLKVGSGPVRTGVTVVHPRGKHYDPVFAGCYALNGNGEMTGTAWIEESGFLESPVAITNTHSVGIVRDTIIEWQYANKLFEPLPDAEDVFWSLPVVAETYDGDLNDINGFHVTKEHVLSALESATFGDVSEGNVGGGTGMICHQFKGGIGTASRRVDISDHEYTLGVLVQANHGSREAFSIAGIPLGEKLSAGMPRFRLNDRNTGSIIVIVATDAPLLPHQLKRIARRVPFGMARVGDYGANTSGDIFLAFSTANPGAAVRQGQIKLDMLPNDAISPLFKATAEATEEAIVNALVAAETMTGINGNTVHSLPHKPLIKILNQHKRLE